MEEVHPVMERVRQRLIASVASRSAQSRSARLATSAALRAIEAIRLLTRDPRVVKQARIIEHARASTVGGVLEEESSWQAEVPRSWAEQDRGMFRIESRLIRWSAIDDVILNDTSMAYTDSRLLAATGVEEDLRVGLRIKGPSLITHSGTTAVLEIPRPTSEVEAGIRLCGTGSSNWYHWLAEILPTSLLIERLPEELRDLPVLVPEAVMQRDTWRQSLSVALPGHETIPVPRTGSVSVKKLVWIDPAINGPRSYHRGRGPDLTHLRPSLSLLRRFRELVHQRLGITPQATPGVRILLVRPPGSKRSTNQEDLIRAGREFGLAPVDPGGLDFVEQARLFAEAELIIGGWGAAWASLMFSAPEARGLMWTPETFRRWALFTNLAAVSGATLRHLYLETGSRDFNRANTGALDVPVAEFSRALATLT